jgi:hypothetical protein
MKSMKKQSRPRCSANYWQGQGCGEARGRLIQMTPNLKHHVHRGARAGSVDKQRSPHAGSPRKVLLS